MKSRSVGFQRLFNGGCKGAPSQFPVNSLLILLQFTGTGIGVELIALLRILGVELIAYSPAVASFSNVRPEA